MVNCVITVKQHFIDNWIIFVKILSWIDIFHNKSKPLNESVNNLMGLDLYNLLVFFYVILHFPLNIKYAFLPDGIDTCFLCLSKRVLHNFRWNFKIIILLIQFQFERCNPNNFWSDSCWFASAWVCRKTVLKKCVTLRAYELWFVIVHKNCTFFSHS